MTDFQAGPLLRSYYGGERAPGTVVLLGAFCPACECEHGFRINAAYWAAEDLAVWTWDGNEQAPTFVGSMLANARQHPGRPLCHSFVENGQWRFLDDCTHDLKGQTVPMVPYPEGYGTGHHALTINSPGPVPPLRVVESPHGPDEWQGAIVELTRDVAVSTGILKRGKRFVVHRTWQDQVFVRLSAGHIGPPLLGIVPIACVRLVDGPA